MNHAPLIIDIAGLTLTPVDIQRLQHPLVGGLILFSRNWHNRQQLLALCKTIKQARPDALICVDHEGGRVQRFKSDGFTHLPPMRELGSLSDVKPAAASALATACGYILATELRACGVDFSFTPVLDLDFGSSCVIGDRAFHSQPEIVTRLAKDAMYGLLQGGMQNCGKHFPGHGYVQADSHTEIPVDERPLSDILACDSLPYPNLAHSLASIMPAHVIYPKIDSRPAGFSSIWLQIILREQLQFQGAIFSDDLSMAGARCLDGKQVDYTTAAIAALNAGCDLVLLCNQSTAENGHGKDIDDLLTGLSKTKQSGAWQTTDAIARKSESRRLRLLPNCPTLEWDNLQQDVNYKSAKRLLETI